MPHVEDVSSCLALISLSRTNPCFSRNSLIATPSRMLSSPESMSVNTHRNLPIEALDYEMSRNPQTLLGIDFGYLCFVCCCCCFRMSVFEKRSLRTYTSKRLAYQILRSVRGTRVKYRPSIDMIHRIDGFQSISLRSLRA